MTTRPSLTTATAAAFALAALLAGARARAETTEPAAETSNAGFAPAGDASAAGAFGGPGQLALSLGATADQYLLFHKSGGAWQLRIAPAADYFLFAHISVGALLAYGHGSGGAVPGTNGLGSDTFSIGARAGYALAFNDRFSVWPLVGLRLDYASANHTSQTNTFLPIYVPALFHPAQHFFVGLGPKVDAHISGQGNAAWGIETALGGWF
jgi:hypothetical protein